MSLNNISDKILVSQYLNGENSSFEILLSRHKSRIFAFIMSKVKNRDLSNDIFQDTFIKVINSLQKGKYNEEGKFLSWVLRIASNLIIDKFRNDKKMPLNRDTDDSSVFSRIKDNTLDVETRMIKNQVEIDLKNIIEELPHDQKEVIMMRYYLDMSFKEIEKNQTHHQEIKGKNYQNL